LSTQAAFFPSSKQNVSLGQSLAWTHWAWHTPNAQTAPPSHELLSIQLSEQGKALTGEPSAARPPSNGPEPPSRALEHPESTRMIAAQSQ
jgi:hypothetical protein